MKCPFDRKDIYGTPYQVLSKGRWANADLYLYRHEGVDWVIKDFMPCSFMVRATWGRIIVRREFAALGKMQSMPDVPQDPFLLDSFALGYRFIKGKTLRDISPEVIEEDFFIRLEDLVNRMHNLNIAHLDIRNRRNIIVDAAGKPALLDFQNCVRLERVPRFLRNLLKNIDLSGVYKHWERYNPESLDGTRKEKLDALNRKRSFCPFKGYPFWMKGDRRS
jgi:RIO-like serine/threonine protein kinase